MRPERLERINQRGFSLIELMVVIVVVGILSAVAIPAYKNYLERTRLSSASVVIDSYDNLIISFYNNKGVFPDSFVDLGVPATTDPDNFVNPPYVISFFGANASVGPTECRNAFYYSYITNYNGNFFDGNGNLTLYYNFFIDVNGTLNKYCAYQEFDSNTSATGNTSLFPNCLQLDNSTGFPAVILDTISNACN